MTYTENQLVKLAKRDHNTKRKYLLVNPLQGKHIPVSPKKSLSMLQTLGRGFAATAPEVELVIGFAETATAVGAVVASMLSDQCRYIHTTREPNALSDKLIEFSEEHSHATEQFLCLDQMENWLKRAHSIAFVDDELSTGKTLLNIIYQIKERYPEIENKTIWVVSIVNKLTDDRISALKEQGINCYFLLRLPLQDLSAQVEKYNITCPIAVPFSPVFRINDNVFVLPGSVDTRHGCIIGEYYSQCSHFVESVYRRISESINGKHVTVLGTEEWMMSGLLLGEFIEAQGIAASVSFHATTRSPIGICTDPEYPIRSGFSLHSFYESSRETFLYNIQPCDVVIILTDSSDFKAANCAYSELSVAFRSIGCQKIILVMEATHVQHLS